MYSDNKQIRDVADIAAKIMYGQQPVTEKLHPNQQKLDVHEPEKDELTSDDFKKLRAGKKADVKKEEVESIDEEDAYEKDRYAVKNGKAVKDNPTHQGSPNYKDQPHHVYATSAENALKKHTKKEEVELDEKISISYKVPTDNENFGAKPGDKTRFDKSPNITRKMQLHRDVTAKAVKSIRAQGGNPANHPDIKINKEEIEQMDEVKMADLPSTKVQGRAYGASKPEPHPLDVMKGPAKSELDAMAKQKKKKKFSEMVNLYQEKGLKSLSEMLVKEEPDNEQFTKELEDAKAKSEGKKRNTEIAKGAVQAVKQEETEITDEMIFEVLENAGIDFESLNDEELQEVTNEAYEILDELSKNTLGSYIKKANYAGGMADFKHGRIADKRGDSKEKTSLAATSTKRQKGISTAVNKLSKEEVEQIEERHMTDDEMAKREKIVKSMKKGMAGFKDRYGDRAKNVMYATATKQAMKD
jgi:hypothetical protein